MDDQKMTHLLDGINKLLPQLSKDAKPMTFESLKAMLSDKHIVFRAIRDGDELIGMACLCIDQTPITIKAHIEDVVVDEKHRGKGIAKQLINVLVAEAKKRGVKYIDLTSRPDRVAANKMYEKLGFIKRKTNAYRLYID